jgi:hypothetical protein
VCQGLLANLQGRGLRTDRSLLVILDGSKALHKAVRAICASRCSVQHRGAFRRRVSRLDASMVNHYAHRCWQQMLSIRHNVRRRFLPTSLEHFKSYVPNLVVNACAGEGHN